MVKQVAGVRWDTNAATWWVPLSWAACVQLRGIFGTELGVGPALSAWAAEEQTARIAPCLAMRDAEDSPTLSTFFTELWPFQRAGADFLRTARYGLLADEMGLGKTVQAIAALEAIGDDAYPVLVVCPNSMKDVWVREFQRWAPSRIAVAAGHTAAKRKKAIYEVRDRESDVLVINYEGLRTVTRIAAYPSVTLSDKDKVEKELNEVEWASVVADEAHKVKDPTALQTRALWFVSRAARYRFALTGTPVANSPEDIWTLMRFVAPHEFPAKTKFLERYAQQQYSVYGFMEVVGVKSENSAELFRIIDPRFIRRTKAAVLPQLPPKVYSKRVVEMAPKQKKAYDAIRTEMMAELDNGVLLATNPLVKLTRLLQFASAYGEIRVEDGALVLTEPSCKLDALDEIVDELGDQRVVVFAESRQLIELAAKRMAKQKIPFGQVTGAVVPTERANFVEKFNQGLLKVLLVTLGAGGEGLSFPGCCTAVFLQRSFSLVKNLQAEDRIHGLGRGDGVLASEIIDVVADGTIESAVHSTLVNKAAKLEEIVRDAETVKRWLSR